MRFEDIEVSTHSGFKADERPLAFTWRGRLFAVQDILDRWYDGGLKPGSPSLNYFKVRTDGGGTYVIRYNSLFDGWAILVPSDEP
jgi:hypothetical protein